MQEDPGFENEIALSRLFVYSSNSRLCACAVVNNDFGREKLTVTSIDLNPGFCPISGLVHSNKDYVLVGDYLKPV